MNRDTHALLGVVLAGGQSSRMGRDKASLPHPEGGTYLTHALQQLAGCCDHLACSIACSPSSTSQDGAMTQEGLSRLEPDLLQRVHPLVDVRSNCGPAEGVSLAVGRAVTLRCAGVLVTPVDLPQLRTEHLRWLASAFTQDSQKIICAVSDDPDSPKPLQPLVAIYPVGFQAELDRLAGSQQRSLYRFIQQHGYASVLLPADALHNVNSPRDHHS